MDYQGIKVVEPVGFFRAVAREALKGRWGLALGAGFLYSVLTTLPVVIFDSLFGYKLNARDLAGMFGDGADVSSLQAIYGENFYMEGASTISGLYSLLTAGAFTLGITIFVIYILRRSEADASMVFAGFGNYFKSLGLMVLIGLITVAALMVLAMPTAFIIMSGNIALSALLIPLFVGMFVVVIIINLIYGLSYFLLADNPGMGVTRCMSLSQKIMKGNKGKLFILDLSFIGWWLLYLLYSLLVGGISALFGDGLAHDIISTLLTSLGYGLLVVYLFTAQAAFYEKVSGISSGMFNLSQNIPNENPGQVPDQNNNMLDGEGDDENE